LNDINFINITFYEKMKVKVFNRLQGIEQFINRKLLNTPTGQKNYEFISDGHPDDADLFDPKKDYPKPTPSLPADELIKRKDEEIAALKRQLEGNQQSENSDAAPKKLGRPKSKSITSSDDQDEK
jgi:hypothetical protein